jgi:hypothetical protein
MNPMMPPSELIVANVLRSTIPAFLALPAFAPDEPATILAMDSSRVPVVTTTTHLPNTWRKWAGTARRKTYTPEGRRDRYCMHTFA